MPSSRVQLCWSHLRAIPQMEELSLQRQDMQNQRTEMARTAQAPAEQVRILASQLEVTTAASTTSEQKRRNEIQPVFQFVEAPNASGRMNLKLVKRGGLAKNIEAQNLDAARHEIRIRPQPADAVSPDGEIVLRVNYSGAPPRPLKVRISRTLLHIVDALVRHLLARP